MHSALWPSLFEYIAHPEYVRAIGQLCKNLAHIAETKRTAQDENYMIKFDYSPNIARPAEILARLIILAGTPLLHKNRGSYALHLMRHISPNLSADIVDLWDKAVPKLIMNLEEKLNNSKFVQKPWEDLIMKLLLNSLEHMSEDEKICDIAKALGKHIETLYMYSTEEKASNIK